MPLPPAFWIRRAVTAPAGGVLEVPVNTDGAGASAPDLAGEAAYAVDGTLVSTQGAEVVAVRCTVGPVTPAEFAEIRSEVRGGRFVEAGGWLLDLAPGATLWCVVALGERRFVPTDTADGPVFLVEAPAVVRPASAA